MSLLDNLNLPADLRTRSLSELESLAAEIRTFLAERLNETGGHFAAGLGVVELTIALHKVFNTPHDLIVWDIGHQAYPHKILTGRKDQMSTLRKSEGLAPFLCRWESPFDTFGAGHSSTSLSAAMGMAEGAKRLQTNPPHVIAVIGDASLTSGMALEALNHIGDQKTNMIIVLNDNEMSISENVGALSRHLASLVITPWYQALKKESKKLLQKIPPIFDFVQKTKKQIKHLLSVGPFFEALGLNYVGPIDGHCLEGVIQHLERLKTLSGPHVLHIKTRKGKGFAPAEANPIAYHAVSPGFLNATASTTAAPKPLTYSDVFGLWACFQAKSDPKLSVITPAMREGSGLVDYAKNFPDQYFDVGIAEQHAVTFAAGLACQGQHPVVAIYSTFLQRAYDQIIHDVALQQLPVLFALDRAGLVPDGPTHSGAFDLSFLRCIPNTMIMAPSTLQECWWMLNTGLTYPGPSFVRFPRGSSAGGLPHSDLQSFPIGKAEILHQGTHLALLAFGPLAQTVLPLAQRLGITLINMRFVKPLDETLLQEIAATHAQIVTLEDNVIAGGAGSGVSEYLSSIGVTLPVLHLGYPDHFIEHGSTLDMMQKTKLTLDHIVATLEPLMPS